MMVYFGGAKITPLDVGWLFSPPTRTYNSLLNYPFFAPAAAPLISVQESGSRIQKAGFRVQEPLNTRTLVLNTGHFCLAPEY